MNGRRSVWRFRILTILALMIALALGSFWLLEVMRRAINDVTPKAARTEPDFYVENFNYVKLSPSGQAQYHISGARLTHNPQDDSYDIQHPVVSDISPERAPMTMRSERAHVNSDNSEVRMYDNVHIDRPASAQGGHLHITSDYMLLLPDDEIMKTDKAVVITLDLSRLTGVGMFANNATREFSLASNVHGTYQAPPQ
jgi:lipopolysaccharide export system protein LptC